MCVFAAYGVPCSAAVCRRSGGGQQGVRPGRGMLHDRVVTRQSPSTNFWQKKHFCGFSAPYTPDLSPYDFFISRLKNHLKGRHFSTLDNIQKSVTDELKGIPAEAFQHCYEQWKQRLRRSVAVQGNYFEGDNLDL